MITNNGFCTRCQNHIQAMDNVECPQCHSTKAKLFADDIEELMHLSQVTIEKFEDIARLKLRRFELAQKLYKESKLLSSKYDEGLTALIQSSIAMSKFPSGGIICEHRASDKYLQYNSINKSERVTCTVCTNKKPKPINRRGKGKNRTSAQIKRAHMIREQVHETRLLPPFDLRGIKGSLGGEEIS